MNAKYDIYAPADPTLAPGDARCPGPSVQDVLNADNQRVSPDFQAPRYTYLGNEDLAFDRYTSEAFHQLEVERLWCRTWQWACREEHIPKVGDYYVYDIDRYSVLVIRGEDMRIRAFVNSCPHRGMQFFDSDTQGTGKQFLRCPFHGMSWRLDGALREIPCRWDFPHVKDEEFGLQAIPCDTWGGFVFINLDANAQPLLEYLSPLPEHFAATPLEDRFVTMHTQKVLQGNWKMCMEGFLEAYHVLATHPNRLHMSAWANTQYDLLSPHVSRFHQPLTSGNAIHPRQITERQLYAELGHDPNELKEGESARNAHCDKLRRSLGESLDVDLSQVPNAIMLDSIEYHVFPNACFFPGITIPLIYRFRPLGHDKTLHDIMLLQPVPRSGHRPKPPAPVKLGMDDRYTSVKDFGFLDRVLDQDSDNFVRQWAGMRTSLKKGQTLANYQEARIRHFHATLDDYLKTA
ncbi:MAG: aromatic ring-hydroxylating dioxygenase subunit alpha [Pseudomonadales bacterium]|nr:aromatic ring-hydroxylating dioxygenase subunit alpha [Pseudomonadales bacterium]MCP5183090.1 aromatic ring-hydroxylating dioxygenase subunit alpha [Pseudomonadales bacterium]